MSRDVDFDIVLVGGGLQGALIALSRLARDPHARIAVLESSEKCGGNHTWSFHDTDVPNDARDWLEPLIEARWSGWDVAFPGFSRTFVNDYASITSSRLHDVVSNALRRPGCKLSLDTTVIRVSPNEVETHDGRTFHANLVVDARGPRPPTGPTGYQKFVGLELELFVPCELRRPIVMDACVPQSDGFRFLYVLPFTPTRVLIEDTFFSDDSTLDVAASANAVREYAAGLGLQVARVVRTEQGVLPLPLTWSFAPSSESPLVGGFAGGWFHPTTGYSFATAVRLAEHVATSPEGAIFGASWDRLVESHERQARFAVMLNRLLFTATPSSHRRDVLERFHRLPPDVIARFYALTTTPGDRLRVVCGRPPRGVSIRRALAEVLSQ